MRNILKNEIENKLNVKMTNKEYEYLRNIPNDYSDEKGDLRALCNYRYLLLQEMENTINKTHEMLEKLFKSMSL